MKSALYILSAILFLSTCNTKDDYIQEVYVNINIDLNLPEYSDLQVSGNSIFIEGGVEGIIIYHGVGNDYKVYDRNCSYEISILHSYHTLYFLYLQHKRRLHSRNLRKY